MPHPDYQILSLAPARKHPFRPFRMLAKTALWGTILVLILDILAHLAVAFQGSEADHC